MSTLLISLLSSVAGGTIVAFVQYHYIWKSQRRLELKRSAFDEAIAALSMYEADVMNAKLQAEDFSGVGVKPQVNLRDETRIKISKATALAPAFFSSAVADALKRAFSANLRLDNIPNDEFYDRLSLAIRLMAEELS